MKPAPFELLLLLVPVKEPEELGREAAESELEPPPLLLLLLRLTDSQMDAGEMLR